MAHDELPVVLDVLHHLDQRIDNVDEKSIRAGCGKRQEISR